MVLSSGVASQFSLHGDGVLVDLDGLNSAGAGLVGACNHLGVHSLSCLAPLVATRGGNLNNADNSAVDGAVVCVVEVPSSGSNKWSKAAKAVNTKMVASANKTGTGTVKTIKVNKDTVTVKAKLTGDTAAKNHTFVIVVAKAA